jgi:tRNA wybutosine-synthesizing protein 3
MVKKPKTENKNAKEEAKSALSEKSRFTMTKKHHKETYEEAKSIGRMDEDFIPLCDYIIKTKNYFTSSSCAGRIALIGLSEEETKQESAFYRKWHRTVTENEVLEAVKDFTGAVLWFKQEPLILHLGTNNIENAKKVLALCEKVGIKRAGIKVAKDGKFIAEILGTQSIDAPVKEGKMNASEDYLKYLVKKGNEKFKKNQELIEKLYKQAKKELE